MVTYHESRVELVGLVASVQNLDGNHRGVTIVVAPMGNGSRPCTDVSLSEAVDLLVLDSHPLALALPLLPILQNMGKRRWIHIRK